MKIYLEDDNGAKVEIKEIESLPEGANVLFFMTNSMLKAEVVEKDQEFLEEVTGVKCIILPPTYARILGFKK